MRSYTIMCNSKFCFFRNFGVLLAHTLKKSAIYMKLCVCGCVHTSRRRRLNNNMANLALMAGEFSWCTSLFQHHCAIYRERQKGSQSLDTQFDSIQKIYYFVDWTQVVKRKDEFKTLAIITNDDSEVLELQIPILHSNFLRRMHVVKLVHESPVK